MADSPRSRRSPLAHAGVLGILWLAAALRWVQPALIEFKYDEAHIANMALGVARGGYFPLLSGGTSLGIQRSALDVYLLALPMAITGGHIEAAVWGMGALGVLATALTYVLGRRVAGHRVGLLAALFMAANPWLVAYDRKLWAHIQVLFSVALLLAAWDVMVRRRGAAAFWAPVVATLQLLSHVLALVQWAGWLGGIAVAPRRWWRRETALGLMASGALLAPYVWGLLHSPQGGDFSSLSARLMGIVIRRAPGADASLASLWRPAIHLFTGDGLSSLVALPAGHSLWWRMAAALAWFVLAVIGVGIIRAARWTRGGAIGGRLLLAWTAWPLLILSLQPMRVYPQYWTVLLPLPALYLALGIDSIAWGIARIGMRRISWGIAGGVAGALALIWVGCYADMLGAVQAGAGG
ncbi:MAG: glycosyltransferase family 39 protein, partial [Chloroflexi bacterium]|nr:glycosyltransferase family 39 protein [Chloroflexota bacterium]